MDMLQYNVYPDAAEAMRAVTAALRAAVAATAAGDFNLVVPGGTTGPALFDFWATGGGDGIDWARVNFFWSDERCVAATDAASNYGTAWPRLLGRVVDDPVKLFRIRGEADPETEAVRYATLLERRTLHFAILGLGADGHTASLFPTDFHRWRPVRCYAPCIAIPSRDDAPPRVTLTPAALSRAGRVAYIVTGHAKRHAVAALTTCAAETAIWPARHIRPLTAPAAFFIGY